MRPCSDVRLSIGRGQQICSGACTNALEVCASGRPGWLELPKERPILSAMGRSCLPVDGDWFGCGGSNRSRPPAVRWFGPVRGLRTIPHRPPRHRIWPTCASVHCRTLSGCNRQVPGFALSPCPLHFEPGGRGPGLRMSDHGAHRLPGLRIARRDGRVRCDGPVRLTGPLNPMARWGV